MKDEVCTGNFVPNESLMLLETSDDYGKTFGPVTFLRLDRTNPVPAKPDWYGCEFTMLRMPLSAMSIIIRYEQFFQAEVFQKDSRDFRTLLEQPGRVSG
jgi:hypothetical protein